MKVTSQLKAWLQTAKGVKPDATEPEYQAAATKALLDKDNPLSPQMLAEFTAGEDGKNGSAIKSLLDDIRAGQDKLNARMDKFEGGGNDNPLRERSSGLRNDAPRMPEGIEKALAGGESSLGDDAGVNVRIKRASERYNKSRSELRFPEHVQRGEGYTVHPRRKQIAAYGSPGIHHGEFQVREPSELDRAKAGAFIKFSVSKSTCPIPLPHQLRMNDHDWDLLAAMVEEDEWGGVLMASHHSDPGAEIYGAIGLNGRQKLGGVHGALTKTLLDDSTSGGLEAAPIFFDDMLITTPLLHGELFPSVEVINVTRGRRIEGATMANVTVGAATEGSAVSLFTTTAFIAAFDTTIFVCMGAIEIGIDFLSDSPIDIANYVTKSYQEQLLKWLDDQIAIGDGTTEPEGLLNSGATAVSSTNAAGGPWTVGDEEALMFAVTKQYQAGFAKDRIRYTANETTYRRLRGTAVTTTDQRRVFGMDHRSYEILGQPFAINESWTNRQQAYANLARYRMYRRLGMTIRWETAGATLGRTNTGLLIARSRWGGQLTDALAASLTTDGMS